MNIFRKLYLEQIGTLLGDCLNSWYSIPPPLWTKPMGTVRAVSIYIIHGSRRFHCLSAEGIYVNGQWYDDLSPASSVAATVSLYDFSLSQFYIESESGVSRGFGLLKGYKLKSELRLFLNKSKADYDSEMTRRHTYLNQIRDKPKTQLELLSLVFDRYCVSKPMPFTARDSLNGLHGEDWSYSHENLDLELKQEFILNSLVEEDVLTKDGNEYKATPKLVTKLEKLRLERDAEIEKKELQNAALKLQNKSASIAQYALYIAILSAITSVTNMAIAIARWINDS